MEDSTYKQLTVSRGFRYNYYASRPSVEPGSSLPTLVFLHGFGIASKDWRHQIPFFRAKGYRILAPDLLGYGGSAMPTTPHDVKHSLVAQDILDILDNDGVQKAVFIGQGGGCPIISRLAQLHPERVEACVFLAISYAPPNPDFDYGKALEIQEKQFGYVLTGYWEFVAGDSSVAVIKDNLEGFFNLIYPDDPSIWRTHFGPVKAMETYLLSGKPLPPPSWFAPEEKKIQYEGIHDLDLTGPFSYYSAYILGIQSEDAKGIPSSRYTLTLPVFFGAALDDYISLPSIGRDVTSRFCTNEKNKVHEFKANHWVHLQAPDEVNDALFDWFKSLDVGTDGEM